MERNGAIDLYYTKIKKARGFITIILPYIVIAFITRLDWQLFRNEPMYVEATEAFLTNLPWLYFKLNFCGTGILLWGLIWKAAGFNTGLFRLSILIFSFISILLAYNISKKFGCQKSWISAFVIAYIPQIFVYSFQINGLMIATTFSLLVLKLYLDYVNMPLSVSSENLSEKRKLFLLLSFCLILALVTNPFLISYAFAIILFEYFNYFKAKGAYEDAKRVISICVLSILAWVVYAFVFGEGFKAIQVHGIGGERINPRHCIFYFGHLPNFLLYLGGTFPFLPLIFGGRVKSRMLVPAVLLAGIFATRFFPLVFDNTRFDPFYLTVAGWSVRLLGLPEMAVSLIMYVLVFLGIYNFVNILILAKKNTTFYFTIAVFSVYIFLMMIDPYISIRLLLPGMMGLFFIISKFYEEKPMVLGMQMLYQLLLTGSYAYGLYLKWGFLKS